MNVVTGTTHTLRGSIGGWSITSPAAPSGSGGAPTLVPSSFSKYADYGSLQVVPVDTQPIYIYGNAPNPPNYFYAINGSQPNNIEDVEWSSGARLRGFAHVYAETPCLVETILVQEWGPGYTQSASAIGVETRVLSDRWTLVSVEADMESTDILRLSLGVRVSGHDGNSFHVCFPVIQWIDEPAFNVFAREAYLWMPQYLRTSDGQQSSPDRPLFRYLEAMGSTSRQILEHQQAFRYVPPDEVTEVLPAKTSDLVDPDTCNLSYLPWLASVLGMDIYSPAVSVVTWESLEDNYLNWTALAALADWDALETSAPAATTFDPYLRAQVAGLFFGQKAGMKETIIAAIRNTQVDPANPLDVQVFSNYGDDPWAVLVQFVDSTILTGFDVQTVVDQLVAAGYEITVNPMSPTAITPYGIEARARGSAMNATITTTP